MSCAQVRYLLDNAIDALCLGLTFTDVADDSGFFRAPGEEVELCEGGASVDVTGDTAASALRHCHTGCQSMDDVIVSSTTTSRLFTFADANKHEYVELLVRWRLCGSVERALGSLRRGVEAVIPGAVLRRCGEVLTVEEFAGMLFGEREIDVGDWRAHAKVEGETLTKARRMGCRCGVADAISNVRCRARMLPLFLRSL